MNQLKISALAVLVTASCSTAVAAQTELQDYHGCGYVSGQALRDANQALRDYEAGSFVTVPLDYDDPSRGTTSVYAFFARKYDPKLPTYAIFLGGPGQHAHIEGFRSFEFYASLPFNFLLLDQRGIGFSRFETATLARDARNYGSVATARDMLAVLDHFGIQKAAIFGASYGTVPATIFAHLYPARTSSLVLEGVMFDGFKGRFSTKPVEKRIQSFYARLPGKTKRELNRAILDGRINSTWLPAVVQLLLTDFGIERLPNLRRALSAALEENSANRVSVMEKYDELTGLMFKGRLREDMEARLKHFATLIQRPVQCRRLDDSEDVNHLLLIKEFGAGEADVHIQLRLENGRISNLNGASYSSFSSKFDHLAETKWAYSAGDFSTAVPTFILQGVADGSTPYLGAINYFKIAARGPAQLFLFDRLGHMPLGQIAVDAKTPEEWAPLSEFASEILRGQRVSCEIQRALKKAYGNSNFVSIDREDLNKVCH